VLFRRFDVLLHAGIPAVYLDAWGEVDAPSQLAANDGNRHYMVVT
jgi:hypothetical protein